MSNNTEKIVNENFGAWLNRARQWGSGVAKGALSGTVLDGGEKPAYNTEVQDELYSAEILQSAIFDAANTIDSVLRSLSGTALYDKAKNSASEMISFLQQSIKTVQAIMSENGEGDMTSKSKYEKNGGLDKGRAAQLKEISDKLDQIVQVGRDSKSGTGVLDKWCREFLGEHNEGFESNEYLSTGNELVSKAQAVMQEVADADKINAGLANQDVDKIIKRALDAIMGKKEVKYKPGSENDPNLIDKNAQVPEAVRLFRENLRKLRIETSNEDVWSDKDDPCADEAATVVSAITKKKYKPKDKEGFKELQKDINSVIVNRPKIKELLIKGKAPKI